GPPNAYYGCRRFEGWRGVPMKATLGLLAPLACCPLMLVQTPSGALRAQDQRFALIGQVTSSEEGPMEGVLVSVKKAGAKQTVTVVSDRQGRYRFPQNRLAPGAYAVRIRAIGYDLASATTVSVAAQKTTTSDLTLRKARDLAAQLTNAEWLASFPGTEEQKASVRGCAHCHMLDLMTRSRHDADEFVAVV